MPARRPHRARASRARRLVRSLGLVGAAVLLTAACGGSVLGAQEDASSPSGRPAAPAPSATPPATPEPGPEDQKADEPGRDRPRDRPEDGLSLEIPDLTLPPRLEGPVTGGDVSWPQCPRGMGIPEKQGLGLPMPLRSARFVVLGLTNGPGFTPNPCLARQVRWVADRHLMAAAYAVSSFPDAPTLRRYGDRGPHDGSTRLGALRNVGYQQARFNLRTMERAGLRSPIVWIDVEPVPVFEWSPDPVANAAVVLGAARGYTEAGYAIGAYSTQYLWETVVGDLRLGVPEWRAAGETSRAEAVRRCGPAYSFQGGEAVLGQWVEASRDRNVTCPGVSAELFRWFHQY